MQRRVFTWFRNSFEAELAELNGTAEARDANAYEYVHVGGDGAAHALAAAHGAAHFKSAVNIVKVTNRFHVAGWAAADDDTKRGAVTLMCAVCFVLEVGQAAGLHCSRQLLLCVRKGYNDCSAQGTCADAPHSLA